ncbi:uncharacterized protein LOC126570222 isoform X3 [Anopheles aquasalis]|uniref:uncharacterized protein LOC126570222 isoform X3 n=1 Tax=Anopheles aquasalis TaxID=42839 RepID=UPI00215B5438|nr:uncharacterized protein LOC126570222 isoform X3 [Anopheles aquasalis]
MNAVNTAPPCGEKEGQGAPNSSPLPKPASEALKNRIASMLNVNALPTNFQIGCTKIVVVNKPMDQEGRTTKPAHHSLSSAIPKLASLKPITDRNSHYTTPENEFVLRGEQQQPTDTNRKLDLVLDKLTQMEGRMILIEKQMYLLEKKIDMHLSFGPVPGSRKDKTDSPDSSLSMFSPVSCLVDLENLEELAKDKNYVNFVKTHIQDFS